MRKGLRADVIEDDPFVTNTSHLSDPRRGEFRVLLVDDDEDFRTMITKQLKMMGCRVSSLMNASEFLAEIVAGDAPYDMAIIDIRLPDLSGDKIISWLKESEMNRIQTLPILIVTGFPYELPKTLHIDNASLALLGKPYRYDDLKHIVTKLLRRGIVH